MDDTTTVTRNEISTSSVALACASICVGLGCGVPYSLFGLPGLLLRVQSGERANQRWQ